MKLEHVNLTVSNLEEAAAFYCGLLGARIRWRRDPDAAETPAVHVGDDETYLAMFQASGSSGRAPAPNYGRVGFNHVGFVVEDLDACIAWLRTQDIDAHAEHDYEPGRRAYFIDPDGIEVELVEYARVPTA